ncbi:M23 family metallopeptidase [Breznakiellaceae bacterium SP9]
MGANIKFKSMVTVFTRLEKSIIRLFMVISLCYFMVPWGIFTADQNRDQYERLAAQTKGMGGMDYPETATLAVFSYGDARLGSETAHTGTGFADPDSAVFMNGIDSEPGILEPDEYSHPSMLMESAYQIEKGDVIGRISQKYGLNQDTLLSYNNIKDSRSLQIGRILKIPNQDGILHTVRKSDTLSSLATLYNADVNSIKIVNELFSDTLHPEMSLFIPGARLNNIDLMEINGELFVWPIKGNFRISSPYGYRANPFNDRDGSKYFHSGIDIAASYGTAIRAAQAGKVITAGWHESFGNYVVIRHHSGYRTLYGHMSVIRVKVDELVSVNERIGDVGNSGKSTGPHLHFTVYKNGVTVNPRKYIN